MRIDLHTHTRLHSPCSAIDPDEMARLALRRGLRAIVITEHNTWWNDEALDRLRSTHPRLKIYSGIEISTNEGYDVVVIGPARLPSPGFLPFDTLVRQLAAHRDDTFLFLPHAFRFHPLPTPDGERMLAHMDGLEMNSVNILRSNWTRTGTDVDSGYIPLNNDQYDNALERHGLVPVFNSDAHHPLAVGAVCMEVEWEEPPEDETALAHALKHAAPEQRQHPALLSMMLDGF